MSDSTQSSVPSNLEPTTAPHVLSRVEDGVLTITWNRPEKKNAFTIDMYRAANQILRQAATDPQVRVVVFESAGDTFSAGNDIRDFVDSPPTGPSSPFFAMLLALVYYEKPIIAAVDGLAIGAGSIMLLHCDLVYATATSRFQFPFVNLGLVPEGGASYLLTRIAGQRKAAELFYLGEFFDAATARDVGLVSEIIDRDALTARVRERAQALARKPPEALQQTKRLLHEASKDAVLAAMEREREVFVERLRSDAATAAFAAFFARKTRP